MEMEVPKGRGKSTKGGKRSRTSSGTTTATVERKEVERERRQHMKQLCAKVASLIPKENYSSTDKDTMTQLSSLDEAARYIKKLNDRVDELRQRRSSAQAMVALRGTGGVLTPTNTTTNGGAGSSELEYEKGAAALVVEVRQHDDSSMDVVLICNADRPIKLHDVVTILEEEGAEIVNANHSVSGLKIFYNIHSRAFSSRIGIEVSRVSERLRALV